MLNSLTSILAQANIITNGPTFLGVNIMDDDFYKLAFRFLFNLIILTIVIRFIYYVKTPRRNYVFTFYMISIISFVIVFALKKLDIDTGMGLGLFAIFGIIRYRTLPLRVREMTYLFIAIGLSVVNGLSGKQVSYAELVFINLIVVLIVYLMDTKLLVNLETSKSILYEKIENIKPQNAELLKQDLEERTGLKINRVEVGKIDFLKDVADVKIFYYDTAINESDDD
jgi:cation transport ATPase